MSETTPPYKESLFQWIWQFLEFNCRNLRTACGHTLEIISQGTLNHGSGPDFFGAHIRTGNLHWHGSVEIHRSSKEWFEHAHHKDESFNGVVLHVIFEDRNHRQAVTADGSEPFTLCLKPYLHKKLNRLIEIKQNRGIPCRGNVNFISQQAFERQIETAHREYFDYKTREILEYYPPGIAVDSAWKQALTTGIYRTLGIPANQEQMMELAKRIITEEDMPDEIESFIARVYQEAFYNKIDPISWKSTGMRPASRPGERTAQAAAFHFVVMNKSLRDFLGEPFKSWNSIVRQITTGKLPGKSRLNLLKHTVYLPALYLLGELLHSKSLMAGAFESWSSEAQTVPEEVVQPFRKAGFDVSGTANCLGLAHQFKRYCIKRNCHRCEVFKNAIRS